MSTVEEAGGAVTPLARWLGATGVTMADLARAAGGMRYATVLEVVGGHVPGAKIATRLAEATSVLVRERALAVPAVTPAQILGVADWKAA